MRTVVNIAAETEEYFKDVRFLVEATSTEKHLLWLIHHHEPADHGLGVIKDWKDETRGHQVLIGFFKNMPVNVVLWYAKLQGIRVCFYEAVSQVVDYRMVNDWIFARTKHIKDERGSWAHADAMNFHNCIHFLRWELDRKLDL